MPSRKRHELSALDSALKRTRFARLPGVIIAVCENDNAGRVVTGRSGFGKVSQSISRFMRVVADREDRRDDQFVYRIYKAIRAKNQTITWLQLDNACFIRGPKRIRANAPHNDIPECIYVEIFGRDLSLLE